LIKARPL